MNGVQTTTFAIVKNCWHVLTCNHDIEFSVKVHSEDHSVSVKGKTCYCGRIIVISKTDRSKLTDAGYTKLYDDLSRQRIHIRVY